MIEPTIADDDLQALFKEAREKGKAHKLLQHGTSLSHPGISCSVLQPGIQGYVQPHFHPNTRETFIHRSGELVLVLFAANGEVQTKYIFGQGHTERMTVSERIPHTLIARIRNSAVLTVYHGGYDAATYKRTSDWAPAEDAPEAARERYLRELIDNLR